MKRLIIFLVIPLLLTDCEMFEDYDKRTYYNVQVVGYVYYYETKEPVPDARVLAWSRFRSNGYATVQPRYEEYTTDSAGYFCIRFIKRTAKENATNHYVTAGKDGYYLDYLQEFTAEELRNAKNTIQNDTLWLKKSAVNL